MTGDATRHFWLTRGVAKALGVSLTEAMLDGRLSEAAFAGLVTECRRCGEADHCVAWLARNGAGAAGAPAFCRNAAALDRLRPGPSGCGTRVAEPARAAPPAGQNPV